MTTETRESPPESPTPIPDVGGKGRNLIELQRAGFRVPETHCEPEDLAAVVDALGPPIAVRSSASVEDGSLTSFAGQFESYLGLETLEAVEDAIAKCRASAAAESVAEYCRKSGIDPGEIRMSVIVQRMIEPVLAGVAFTVNPVTGAEEVVVEAVHGLAEDLLLGRAEALPADDPVLVSHRPEIERVARAIQRHFGAPQDVEFAVDREGDLFILQTRPITRITFPPDIGEWTNADFRDGGVSSTVCTPLMWSLYDFIWEDSLKEFFRTLKLMGPADPDFQAGRMFFGRPYWNLGAVKGFFAKLPGFVEREFDLDLSVELTYEGDGRTTPVTLRGILGAIPTALAIGRFFKAHEAFCVDFLEGGFDRLEAAWEELPGDEAALVAGLRTMLERDYFLTERKYFATIYAASVAKLELLDAFPDADYVKLVAALPPMRHMAPIDDLRAMAARGETDVGPLLHRHRHHSRKELDIRVPRWDGDRPFVEELLRGFRDGSAGGDPRPAYERARAEARAAVPWWRRGKLDAKLDRLRRFVWLREEMRDCSSKMYYHIRRWVVALAEARDLGDDVWFHTWRELLADDRTNVARARETYDSYRSFQAPNEVGSRYGRGDPSTDESPATGEGRFQGIGASQGEVTAIARIARSVEEASRVEKGAVLVCPFTDPGWTPVLDRVAGVVTETGGLLSHAAVICREYGIPAVLDVRGATRRIRDGQRIRIDGGRGTVQIIVEPAA